MTSALPKVRGGDAVRSALLEAAGTMLGEVGPRRLSVRDVADRAGVNHGQVHHYFGGKRPLLEEAMRQLARRHYEHALALSGDLPYPPPLSLAEDSDYWRAVTQVVMDGDFELARIEIDDGISVPRRALAHLEASRSSSTDPLDVKAEFAAIAAAQLGWVAFENFLFLLADVKRDQHENIRRRVRALMQQAIDETADQGTTVRRQERDTE